MGFAKKGPDHWSLVARRNRKRIVGFQTAALLLLLGLALCWFMFDAGWLEPITLLVSTLLAIIGLRLNHIAPPLHQVSEPEIRRLIAASNPASDWRALTIYDGDVKAFEHEPGLRIVRSRTDESEVFGREDWMPGYWAPSFKHLVRVEWNGDSLFQIHVIGVDGNRALLPLPNRRNDRRVTALQDVISRVTNLPDDSFYSYDKYFAEAGLSVVESAEMKVTPFTLTNGQDDAPGGGPRPSK